MKFLSKSLLVFVIISCLFVLTSCISSRQGKDISVNQNSSLGDIEHKTPEKTNPTEKENSTADQGITVSEQVLLDKDGIKITLKGFQLDGIFGPSLKVLVENNTNEPITVQTRDTVVNGVMQTTTFSCDVVSGKKANDEIIIMNSGLDRAGIEVIKDIELKFHIFNTDPWDTIFDSEAIFITTTADPSYVQKYDDSGFVALEKNGIKIVIKN